jgi:hypothetical protein
MRKIGSPLPITISKNGMLLFRDVKEIPSLGIEYIHFGIKE